MKQIQHSRYAVEQFFHLNVSLNQYKKHLQSRLSLGLSVKLIRWHVLNSNFHQEMELNIHLN